MKTYRDKIRAGFPLLGPKGPPLHERQHSEGKPALFLRGRIGGADVQWKEPPEHA
jgi:hypothetical protein